MKKHILFICLMTALASAISAAEEPTFIQQVNALWKTKSYSQILPLAMAEAAKQPPPPEAYVVLFGYHVYITSDHEQAVQSLDALLASLENTNPEGHQAVTEFKSEFLQVPSEPTRPLTSAELDELQQKTPNDFPVTYLLILIAKQPEP